MFNFRYLSFCNFLNAAPKKFVHQVVLKEERLEIEGAVSENTNTVSLLEKLITQARIKEWHSHIDDIYSLQSSKDCLPMHDAIRSNFEAIVESRADIFKEDNPLQKALEHTGSHTTDREIFKTAQDIKDRKTVFLLPDYTDTRANLIPSKCQEVEKLSSFIYESLKNGNSTIGILRVTRNNKIDPSSIFNEVIQNLLMSISGIPVTEEQVKRPGPILVEGETGTGKSVGAYQIARLLKKELVLLNLAAVSDELLESRIRGYKKGAFTGAYDATQGVFEIADKKVLFLDELQSASLPAQTQLLDLLSAVSNDVTLSKMGEFKPETFNVKLIMAVNRPLTDLLKEGKLRYDLFHRVRDVIHLPSFDQRFEEVVANAERERKSNKLAKQAITDRDSVIHFANPITKAENANRTFIRTLLTIYRWRWQSCVDLQVVKREALTSPFFNISNEALDCMIRFSWSGNFRQFERFSYDLFDTANIHSKDDLSIELVKELLEKEQEREGAKSLPAKSAFVPKVSKEQEKLEYVQKLLVENNYVIKHCLDDLALYSLKSRQALKAYLLRNWGSLESQIKNQVMIDQFVHGKKARAVPTKSGNEDC